MNVVGLRTDSFRRLHGDVSASGICVVFPRPNRKRIDQANYVYKSQDSVDHTVGFCEEDMYSNEVAMWHEIVELRTPVLPHTNFYGADLPNETEESNV